MPIGAAIGAVGSIASSAIGSSAAKKASQASIAEQQSMFDKAQNALSPYYSSGADYGNVLKSLLTPGANQTETLSQIPGFQFAQDWGQKATQNLGTTTGLGGNVLTAGANFATGLAQQGYQNIIGGLQNAYGTGASAAGALGTIATNTGQSIGNTASAGILGQSNALQSGISGVTNSITTPLLLNKLFGGGAASGNNTTALGMYSSSPLNSLSLGG